LEALLSREFVIALAVLGAIASVLATLPRSAQRDTRDA
jgi:hypothetical protein